MATQARAIKTTIDTSETSLVIEVTGKEDIIVRTGDLQVEMQVHAMLHGLKQKICDAAALGAGYTLTEKYDAMMEVVERITSNGPSWNKRGVGSGNGGNGLLFQALCELYSDKDSSDIRNYLKGLDKKQQAALRGNPKIAVVIEDIKSRKIDSSGIDSDELLDGLEGL